MFRSVEEPINFFGEIKMRRRASEVIRDLEIRIAFLEKRSSRRWPYLGATMGQKIEKMIDRKYPNQKPWRDQEPISGGKRLDQKNGFRMFEIESPHTNGYYAIIRGDELISVHEFYDEAVRTFNSEARLERQARSFSPQEVREQIEKADQLRNVDPTLAKALVESGDHTDDRVSVSKKTFSASALKPSQTTMVLEKSVGMAFGMLQGFLNTDLGAIISKDNHIMDGHHRWSAAIIANGGGVSVGGYKADLLGAMLVRVLNIMTKGFFGKRNGKPGTGSITEYTPRNVEAILRAYVVSGIPGDHPVSSEKVQQILVDNFGSVEDGIETMSQNVRAMSQQVPSWAPDRVDMPVIDPKQVPQAAKLLNEGDVHWHPPHNIN